MNEDVKAAVSASAAGPARHRVAVDVVATDQASPGMLRGSR